MIEGFATFRRHYLPSAGTGVFGKERVLRREMVLRGGMVNYRIECDEISPRGLLLISSSARILSILLIVCPDLFVCFNDAAINFTHRIDEFSFGQLYPSIVNPLDESFEISNSREFYLLLNIVALGYWKMDVK